MRIILIVIMALFINIPAALADVVIDNTPAAEDADFTVGKEYLNLPKPPTFAVKKNDDKRVEVISFFWYNCGSCFYLDSDLSAWSKKLPSDVIFVRMPFTYQPILDVHAKIFFALQQLGKETELNTSVFSLFQEKGQPVNTPEDLPKLAQALKINEAALIKAYNSPEVSTKLVELKKLLKAYNLNGVPSMVINGKYLFDIGTVKGPGNYFKLADWLIEKERQSIK